MEFRKLGGSGFKVPVLSFGAGTRQPPRGPRGQQVLRGLGDKRRQGGHAPRGHLPRGGTQYVRLGGHLFRRGVAEETLGQAIKGRRDQVIISTKGTFRMGPGENDVSFLPPPPDPIGRGEPAPARHRLHRPVPAARLRRGDAGRGGAADPRYLASGPARIRYLGVSNFSGWHLMKSLAASERLRPRPLCRPPGLLFPDRPRAMKPGAGAARSASIRASAPSCGARSAGAA